MKKLCSPQKEFFDTDFIRTLNDILRPFSISCAMTVFDEALQNFKAMIWSNSEEKDPPYKDYIKSDRFQQYIKKIINDSPKVDKPFQLFVGSDFFPGNNYDDEPYIKLLQDYYPNLSIKYSVKVPLGKHKNYWLNLFKKHSDGDFQENELELISCICEIIVSAYNTYNLHVADTEKLRSINDAFDYFGAGLVTFDKHYNSLSFMGLSNDIIHSITGCVRKSEAIDSLLRQIHKTGIKDDHILSATLHEYKCYLDEPQAMDDCGYILFFPHAEPANPIDTIAEFELLTMREKEVAMCLASGCSYKDISESLYISISTVRNHVTNIYRKLNINNQRQLISIYFGKSEKSS